MGQTFAKGVKGSRTIPPLLHETQIFATWNLSDVRELWKRFQNQIFGFAIVEAQFESIMAFKENITKHASLEDLFGILDDDHDGRIDGLEFLGGLLLCCRAPFEEKTRFCFEVFDFNLNASLSEKEMVMMMMSCINGMNLLTGGGEELEPDIDALEALVADAFIRADQNQDGQISYEEFVFWARSNRDLMAGLETLSKVSVDANNDLDSEDSAEEYNEGHLSDVDDLVNPLMLPSNNGLTKVAESAQWQGQLYEPTNHVSSKRNFEGPDTNMYLSWAFGYGYSNSRNNLRYVNNVANPDTKLIVYFTAALAVVQDLDKKQQVFYQGHSEGITCMAVHCSSQIIATSDMSGCVHIWNAMTLSTVCIIAGMVQAGIELMKFSPLGDRLATVGRDSDHTLVMYDVSTGEVLSSARSIASPNYVCDMAFATNGSELAIVGHAIILFFKGVNTSNRALQYTTGKIGKIGKKQTFFCVCYFGDDCLVGCAGGELYRFTAGHCIQVVQAHGIHESILCMSYCEQEGTLVTGGRDCVVRTFDSTLKAVGASLDMSEDFDGDGKADNGSLNCVVISVQHLNNRILIGTKGGDIFEASVPANPMDSFLLNRVTWSHAYGQLWALCTHPMRDEFVTCGDDKTMRIWSIRSHEQINLRVLPCACRSVAYDPLGNILCLGMEDGSVALIDATTAHLRVYSTWQHSNLGITDIKFSQDGSYLATASKDGNIYIYSRCDKQVPRTYRRYSVCRGHTAAVTHIDISANSQSIRSNSSDMAVIWWDLRGNQIKAPLLFRDLIWNTNTCIFDWATQGIWPKQSCYNEVLCAHGLTDLEDVITGNYDGSLKLFRYPTVQVSSLHQTYVGHSGAVSNVRFSSNRRCIVSIGCDDRSILMWSHDIEQVESSSDEENMDGYSSASSGTGISLKSINCDLHYEIPDVGDRSALLEAVNGNKTTEELMEIAKSQDMESYSQVLPWKAAVVEPSEWTPVHGPTDVDLSLQWVHGYRSSDARNNLFYSSSGAVVFVAAALAIVYSKSTGKQKFLQGAHKDEVIGIAAHPTGEIFATGEAGRRPSVIIWSSATMRILARIEHCHKRGVPLLSFSHKGNYLACIGQDGNHTMTLHDWAKEIEILHTPTDKCSILCMCFMSHESAEAGSDEKSTSTGPSKNTIDNISEDIIITGGEKHLKFWWAKGQNVQSQCAMWANEKRDSILCVASGTADVCVTGSVRAQLLLWKNFKVVSNVKKTFDIQRADESSLPIVGSYPHTCPIQCIWAITGSVDNVHDLHDCLEGLDWSARYLTADKGGNIALWRLVNCMGEFLRLVCVKSFNVNMFSPKLVDLSVRSICERDGTILVGVHNGEIFEIAESSISDRLSSQISISTTSAASLPHSNIISSKQLMHCHSQGEIWGLACHPQLSVFVTAGDDATLRCWSLQSNAMISYLLLPQKARAVDIVPTDGSKIAVVMNSGLVWVLDTSMFLNPRSKPNTIIDIQSLGEQIELARSSDGSFASGMRELSDGPTQWAAVVKFSFDGTLLAIGSNDSNIYIYDLTQEYALCVCCGHSSMVSHIDFGVQVALPVVTVENKGANPDNLNESSTITTTIFERFDKSSCKIVKYRRIEIATICKSSNGSITTTTETSELFESDRLFAPKDICLQSSSSNHELLFWNSDGSKISSASIAKDAWWSTWTIPFGWSVQGIWSAPEPDGTEYTALARSHSWDVVPVLATADEFGRIRLFNYPCISAGSPDKVYRGHASHVTNIQFSADDAYCITIGGRDRCVFVWQTDIPDEIRERASYAKTGSASVIKQLTDSASTDLQQAVVSYELEDFGVSVKSVLSVPVADEFTAVKPWKGSIREPSKWNESSYVPSLPDASLELSYVYGYRGWDCRNNIGFADSRFEIVYHIAGVGIVLNSDTNTQIHNTEHDDDIISLSVHPDGHTVATGEIGSHPKIVMWDANTGVTINVIKFHKRGVTNLCFSSSGAMLISCGMDDDRTIAVHNARTGVLLGNGKAGRGIDLHSLAVCGDTNFVTGGKNHVRFWELPSPTSPGGELSSKGGIYNNKSVTSRSVVSLAYLGVDAISGMADGTILLWKDRANARFSLAHAGPVTAMCSMNEANSGPNSESVDTGKQIITGGKDGFVHVWNIHLTKVWTLNMHDTTPVSSCPQIQSLSTRENRLIVGTKACEIYEINMLSTTEVHRLVIGHCDERSELWALSTHPSLQRFATACDDMTVRVWDSRAKALLHISTVGKKIRAIAWSPDGDKLAVGSTDGRLIVLSSDLSRELSNSSISAAGISVLQYSPSGTLLAVGTRDSSLFLLDTSSYSCKFKCRGHHAAITAVDFSRDGTRLQSCSMDYELLYWDTSSGSAVTSATVMRDVQWSSCTCMFGWGVQGIWPKCASGSDINSLDRAPNGSLIVTGDDNNMVNLLSYPCPREYAPSRPYKAHAEHVTSVRFNFNGTQVFSTGGLDKAIVQFEVKQAT